MPRLDKTGPQGIGPLTGRGAGNCSGDRKQTDQRPRCGRGSGRGLGLQRNIEDTKKENNPK
jgi:hypothetical protein